MADPQNKKINDLAGAAVTDNMQVETDIGGTTANKVNKLQTKDYVNAGRAGGKTIEGGTLTTETLREVNNTVDQKGFTIDGAGDVAFDKSISVDTIDFLLSSVVSIQEGKAKWDAEAGTLTIGMAGGVVALQVGQENHLPDRAKNTQGVQIDDGQAVYVSGATGGVVEVKLANASDFENACKTIAVATQDVLDNQRGYYTTFGIVRGIKTDYPTWTEGNVLYLDASDGGLTNVKPDAPNCVIEIGYVLRLSATVGEIFVNIDAKRDETVRAVTKEPTGFTAPENVIVTGDGTARTITLTNTVHAYWRGIPVPDLITGYISPAHANDTDPYFLVYDGTSVSWITPTSFDFAYLLIAYTFYDASNAQRVYMRECHGVMAWETHRAEHRTIGTYRHNGGTLSAYILASTTAADRRPSISSTSIFDEDLPTTNPFLAAGGSYNNFFLSSTDTPNFAPTAVEVVPVSGTQPYWNEFTGGAWQQTLMTNNYYQSIWLAAVPASADSDSQDYRYLWVQGQNESLTLAAQQGLSTLDVSLGAFNDVIPEIIFIQQVIIKYVGGNWTFAEVRNLTGTRFLQSSSPQGDFLSVVTSDTSLNGSGTVSDPLSVAIPVVVGDGTDSVHTAIEYNNASTSKPVVKLSPTIGGISNYHGTHWEVTETAKAAGNHLESHGAGANDIVSTRAAAYSLNRYMGYMATGQLQSGTRKYWGEEYDSSTGNLTFKTIDNSTVTNRFRIDFASGVMSALTSSYASLVTSSEHIVNKGYLDAVISGALIFQGDWNANTNTPDITGTTVTGYMWHVTVAGNTNLGGITDWEVGDMAVKSAAGWAKFDNTDIQAVWGNITGTLSNQTDLQGELDAKEPTLSKGNLTEATSSVLTITTGTGAVIGSGTTIEVDQSDTSNDGYLSSTDWDTFNDKQAALTNGVDALTSGEVTQLANIGSTTVSAAQWVFVGGTNVSSNVVAAPATPASSGAQGNWAYTHPYLYKCVATNIWVRHVIESSW